MNETASPRRRKRSAELLPPSLVPEPKPTPVPPAAPSAPSPEGATTPAHPRTKIAGPKPPFLLDFYPLETADQTRLSQFFEGLRKGRFITTRCPNDREVHWPPRLACPKCHTESLEWVDLPARGTLYAFSAVLAGAPLGMEADVPFAVGLVDLDGSTLRLYGRIVGRPWEELKVGDPVRVEPFTLDDGRVFYRFRAGA
ncbi:MAG TPA: Zn-ribbon domain-containing OB-fold protein [Thermoplasmata archaeon]|nr:Zn-ribbon domain-containing OB-fold protein [Thermoplasmata archaeon]